MKEHLDRTGRVARSLQCAAVLRHEPEEAVDNTQVMAIRDITRVGLQDDMHAIAKPEQLTMMLEDLKIALQACGHRPRMPKRKVWFPGRDVTLDDSRPGELQLIPREVCGLELLGAAAQGDWCAAKMDDTPRKVFEQCASTHPTNPQADDGKGRHKAWMMLTKVAMNAPPEPSFDGAHWGDGHATG